MHGERGGEVLTLVMVLVCRNLMAPRERVGMQVLAYFFKEMTLAWSLPSKRMKGCL